MGNTSMNRRSLVAAAAATPALAAPAITQTQHPEVRWRLASSFPRNLDILFFGAEQVSRRVAELTDGRFQIRAFYYAPSFWEPCARGHLLVGQRAWAPLPDAYKAAVQVACVEVELEMMARYDQQNPLALRRLVAAGAQLRAFPREVLQAGWRAGHELLEETASKNARFKRIWDSYRPFRDDQFQWFRVAENAYDNFAFSAAAAR